MLHNLVAHMLHRPEELVHPAGAAFFFELTAASGCSEQCLRAYVAEVPLMQACANAAPEDCAATPAPCPATETLDPLVAERTVDDIAKAGRLRVRAWLVAASAAMVTTATACLALWLCRRQHAGDKCAVEQQVRSPGALAVPRSRVLDGIEAAC